MSENDVTAEHGWLPVRLMSRNAMVLMILITAVLARIYIYSRAPSLWGDEIYVSLNVITHPLLALTHKLDLHVLAPLGFLWMQRLIVDWGGVSERTLRLVPLIAGCLSIVAVWDMARRFLDRYTALIAAALIGFAPFALRYSNEAKQYSVELFITAMLLWLRSYTGDMPRKPTIQAGVIATGAVACLFSLPAVFVLGGLWASYAAVALRAENRRQALIFVGLAGFIWSAVFGVIYVTLLAPHSDAFLRRVWRPLDLSIHLRDVNLVSVIAQGFLDPSLSFDSRIPLPVLAAGSICLVLGGYALAKLRGLQVALLFVTPLVLCLAAALVGQWYLAPRLMLWTVPLCVVLIAAAICWITDLSGRFAAQVRFIAAVAIIAFPLKGAAYWVRNPTVFDPRAVVEFCQHTLQPEDVVYVSAAALKGWMFYSTNWATLDRTRYNWLKRAIEEVWLKRFTEEAIGGHCVVSEGLELWRPYGRGVELVGSQEWCAGWADNEVHRILATHRRRIVLMGPSSGLVHCLKSNGGVVIDRFPGAGVVELRGSGPGVPCSD